ncbi:MAG: diaminopimelate epimerase [Syntrophobacteraceae bacterium]|jgi:diaminopimelate epimerase|nr:diaminopimelate epimerase [Syntrophobacteraceae bacterium]
MESPGVDRIPFFKMTGSGNDFILIDNRSRRIPGREKQQELARKACRGKLSVGADGLILIENDPEVDFQWRFYNADGSEAEMCGNGARCAARFAHLSGIAPRGEMAFRTLAGIIEAEIRGERVKIRTTPPHGLAAGLELQALGRSFALDFVNTGVPHAVQFVESADTLEAAQVVEWGRALRFHPHFQPAGTNVSFAHVRDAHRLTLRTYERGVEGETLACGTGSIATALLAAARGWAESPVDVLTRSGETLTIYFNLCRSTSPASFTDVCLEGDARVVYQAELWDETLRDG